MNILTKVAQDKWQLNFNPNHIGREAQIVKCDGKNNEKCLCSYHNNTAFIKQLSLFDTVMTNT